MAGYMGLSRAGLLIQTSVFLYGYILVVRAQNPESRRRAGGESFDFHPGLLLRNSRQFRNENKSGTSLLDFYRDLNPAELLESETGIKRLQNPSILEANTTRKMKGRVSSIRATHDSTVFKLILTFNISRVISEKIRIAELHLSAFYQTNTEPENIRLKVHGQKRYSTYTSRHHQSVDVTKTVRSILHKGNTELTVRLTLRYGTATSVGWLMRRLSNANAVFLTVLSERRMLVEALREQIRRIRTPPTNSRPKRRKPSKTYAKDGKCLCQKRDLPIDVSVLGWDDRLVYPTTFNAFYCDGRCPTLIGKSYNPTNHAILQSLYRLKLSRLPRPSCVPTRLRPLSMLYYENNELVLQVHKDMVVEECGCR